MGDDETRTDKLKVWFEEDTEFLCVVYPAGRLEGETARELMEKLIPYQVGRGKEPSFILVDARHLTGISPEARKAFGEARFSDARGLSYIATFGGSFAFRALANLVIKALMLVSKQMVLTLEVDEAAARAWLAEHRRNYFAGKAKT